ncbi:MAG: transposase [Rhodobacteraceae bacterium]|nr:transposase [Paracoccaceae bacterium]
MSRQPRRHFTGEFKEQAVACLSEPGATQPSVARELGVSLSQIKGRRLELMAADSAEAIRRQQAEAAVLHRENRRLKEEVEVMRKASAFFARWAAMSAKLAFNATHASAHAIRRMCRVLAIISSWFHA